MAGKMDCFGLSDIGRVRSTNEDQFIIADLCKSMRIHQTSLGLNHQTRMFGDSQGKLFAVADGMGGHAAGERASMIVIDSINTYALNTMEWYFQLDDLHLEDAMESLKEVALHCHQSLTKDIHAAPQREGMGATLTMAHLRWPELFVVHVGDSRCYLYRDEKLQQISKDHTMAQYMVETGAMKPEEAAESKYRNQLYNVIGGDEEGPQPDVYHKELKIGDVLLLCTDGLTNHVSDEQIAQQLGSGEDSERICTTLLGEALSDGGKDNITLVVARFLDADNPYEVKTAALEIPESQRDVPTTSEIPAYQTSPEPTIPDPNEPVPASPTLPDPTLPDPTLPDPTLPDPTLPE